MVTEADDRPCLAVTTSGEPGEDVVARAREAASRWGLPFVPRRRKQPLGPMLAGRWRAFLVFSGEGVSLVDAQGVTRWTPGMARLRVKRIDAGVRDDLLVRLGELSEGDSVLDCTLGLAADALVAARAVGPRGRVVGLEKSLPVCALVSEGLSAYDAGERSCRVEVLHADAAAYLATASPRSFDVVLFDPMFERPLESSEAFEVLRRYADHSRLTGEMLERARRVARRWVLVKAARRSPMLRRLGLTPHPTSRHASVDWVRLVPS